MSFGGGGNTVETRQPYAPAQGALNQIISETQQAYNLGGVQYAQPSDVTFQGLASADQLAQAAQQQQLATLQGQFTNPFLSPIIQDAAASAYSGVADQFSGAGRTPTSPVAQQTAIDIAASAALPFAFRTFENERGRQMNLANRLPTQFAVGRQLDALELERQQAPFRTLSSYSSIINPIASGIPTTIADTSPDRFTQALGAAAILRGLL